MLNGIHFSKWPDHLFNWKNELVSKISGMPAVWQFFIYNLQLSIGEICVANIIPPPPANGASQGNYFLQKSHILIDIKSVSCFT